jgi:peptide/nickel transport system substrate-binding protein
MMSKIGLAATALLLVGIVGALFLRPEVTSPDQPSGRVGDRGAVGDPAERTGALVDQIVFTQESDVGKVTGLIESGTHHLFGQESAAPRCSSACGIPSARPMPSPTARRWN